MPEAERATAAKITLLKAFDKFFRVRNRLDHTPQLVARQQSLTMPQNE
jgi:hypothetical protein